MVVTHFEVERRQGDEHRMDHYGISWFVTQPSWRLASFLQKRTRSQMVQIRLEQQCAGAHGGSGCQLSCLWLTSVSRGANSCVPPSETLRTSSGERFASQPADLCLPPLCTSWLSIPT